MARPKGPHRAQRRDDVGAVEAGVVADCGGQRAQRPRKRLHREAALAWGGGGDQAGGLVARRRAVTQVAAKARWVLPGVARAGWAVESVHGSP
jgi:hypothetical protein